MKPFQALESKTKYLYKDRIYNRAMSKLKQLVAMGRQKGQKTTCDNENDVVLEVCE